MPGTRGDESIDEAGDGDADDAGNGDGLQFREAKSAASTAAASASGPDAAGGDDYAKRKASRIAKGGVALILAGILAFVARGVLTSGATRDTSLDTLNAYNQDHYSTSIQPGTYLFTSDDNANSATFDQDYTIDTSGARGSDTTLYLWDYGAEDGDYVQVYVDGVATGAPFMLLHKTTAIEVPVDSTVTVVGTRDGGGGITYAVYCDATQTTYFNGMNVNGDNTYTLTTSPAGAQ